MLESEAVAELVDELLDRLADERVVARHHERERGIVASFVVDDHHRILGRELSRLPKRQRGCGEGRLRRRSLECRAESLRRRARDAAAAHAAVTNFSVYAATKGALISMVKGLSTELAGDGEPIEGFSFDGTRWTERPDLDAAIEGLLVDLAEHLLRLSGAVIHVGTCARTTQRVVVAGDTRVAT